MWFKELLKHMNQKYFHLHNQTKATWFCKWDYYSIYGCTWVWMWETCINLSLLSHHNCTWQNLQHLTVTRSSRYNTIAVVFNPHCCYRGWPQRLNWFQECLPFKTPACTPIVYIIFFSIQNHLFDIVRITCWIGTNLTYTLVAKQSQ